MILVFQDVDPNIVQKDFHGIRGDSWSDPTSSPKDKGMFSRFVSQIFDQTSWQTDPLEDSSHATDGDMGLAVTSSIASASSRNFADMQQNQLFDAKATHSKLLTSHPTRQLFLSGCNDSGRLKLWQYDGPRPIASFTPIPYSDLREVQSGTEMLSFSSKFMRSHSLTSKMGHWGGASDIIFSDSGERFAAIGDGGVVATWRVSGGPKRPSDVDGAFCSEWWCQVRRYTLFISHWILYLVEITMLLSAI